jgi:transcriptional regulator with XRE-family HTH domain
MSGLDERLDPVIIGKNIRRIRKNKGLTIVELANRLGYATGKISNIENGKRINISLDELEKFSKALNVPLEELVMVDPSPYLSELEELRHSITVVQHKLSAGWVNGLNKTLEHLREKAAQSSNQSIWAHLSFLWAEYYRAISDFESAMQCYRESIESHGQDLETVEIKMRSFNGLASLLVEKQKLFDAIDVLRESLNYADHHPVCSIDLSNVHFNLTILYLHIGHVDLAKYHIQTCMEITHNKHEQTFYQASFLMSITYMINKRYQDAYPFLIKSMSWFQRQKDLDYLYKSLELIFFLQRVRPNHLFADLLTNIKDFLDIEVPANILSQQYKCFFRLIELEIENENYDDARNMIDKCKQRFDLYSIKDGYKLFALEAYLIRKTSEDRKAERAALENALYSLPQEDNSVDKANILFRLGQLHLPERIRLYEEALRIYTDVYQEKYYIDGTLLSFLPKLRY